MRGMLPVNALIFGAVGMVAEVYLMEWERVAGGAGAQALERAARGACKLLRAFGWLFPFARPFSLLCTGQEARLSGRKEAALRAGGAAPSVPGRWRCPSRKAGPGSRWGDICPWRRQSARPTSCAPGSSSSGSGQPWSWNAPRPSCPRRGGCFTPARGFVTC
ncbi:hypothetical protein ACN28S_02390 [Cystobacter fuscus]